MRLTAAAGFVNRELSYTPIYKKFSNNLSEQIKLRVIVRAHALNLAQSSGGHP